MEKYTLNPERVPLWLDCDTGHDDAFAILLAAHHPSLNLLGISTVHGNASLEQTTHNTLTILTAIGRSYVPVHPGTAKPFCRSAKHAADIHGASGLDGTTLLPEPAAEATEMNAVLAMRHAIGEQPKGTVWLVTTGPLSNAALLFAMFPELVEHIKGLSVMGGAVGGGFTDAPMGHVEGEGERIGNSSIWAEFNIKCDPESAQSIFSNPRLAMKTTLVPLDLTHQVLATKEVQRRLLAKTPFTKTSATAANIRQMFHDLLLFFSHTYSEVFGFTKGPPLHDPVVVAVLLDSVLDGHISFDDRKGERWIVNVVTDRLNSLVEEGRGQVGRTVVTKSNSGGVRIPRGLDVESFWVAVERCLQQAERAISDT